MVGRCQGGPARAMDDKYGTGQKGLNTSGGTNRFKFQGKQARAKRVDVDVAHKVRAEGFLDADQAQDPDVEGGSFFQQELDRSKELNVTPPFKRFYYKVRRSLQIRADMFSTDFRFAGRATRARTRNAGLVSTLRDKTTARVTKGMCARACVKVVL